MSSFDEYLIGLVGKWNGWGLVLFTVITSVIAAVLTGLIGFEREREGQAAGLRTHVVIGIASAMVRTISIYAIRVALAKTSGFFLRAWKAESMASGFRLLIMMLPVLLLLFLLALALWVLEQLLRTVFPSVA